MAPFVNGILLSLVAIFVRSARSFSPPRVPGLRLSDLASRHDRSIPSLSPRSAKTSLRSIETRVQEDTATDEERLDACLESCDLPGAIALLLSDASQISMTRDRFVRVFAAVEERSSRDVLESRDKTDFLQQESVESSRDMRMMSPGRREMTDTYEGMKSLNYLSVFGASTDGNYPAAGSQEISPATLEAATGIPMEALTPQSNNAFTWAGVAFAVAEGCLSLATGINLNVLVGLTLLLVAFDQLLLNGGLFETALKTLFPEYRAKVLRHEAGHFLIAHLLGCPVEGCVLSAWSALSDARFGGAGGGISAGTSFYDPVLSREINDSQTITRSSIDRYSCIVMAGIAAEAVEFGKAEGGAGDEMALIQFLLSINPRSGKARVWDEERIRNQARWGAMQAVLLLEAFRPSYDALVDALERGGGLGECIYAIEKAAVDNNLKPMKEPLGYVRMDETFGRWEVNVSPSETGNVDAPSSKGDGVDAKLSDAEIDKELLRQSKEILQGRIDEIDQELRNLD
uniref:Peptidase M41 domain-containing protein n=2 Tax=Corethron hystrix TaxID=216773 RepID=A0A7S1FXL6_9STRA|mmetsp:Transcript_40015/g.93939  ORF Transcript_40015/g.93939 Transcript_40015/m.93939 type:complete len:515 (+) Transcript_40015:150-1694(+)